MLAECLIDDPQLACRRTLYELGARFGRRQAPSGAFLTAAELADRLFAALLGLEAWRLRRGDLTEGQYREMGKQFDRLADCPIYLDDDPDTTLTNLRSKARRQQIEHGMDLLVIDYLQLIQLLQRGLRESRDRRLVPPQEPPRADRTHRTHLR